VPPTHVWVVKNSAIEKDVEVKDEHVSVEEDEMDELKASIQLMNTIQ
jgi:hypothetical protein